SAEVVPGVAVPRPGIPQADDEIRERRLSAAEQAHAALLVARGVLRGLSLVSGLALGGALFGHGVGLLLALGGRRLELLLGDRRADRGERGALRIVEEGDSVHRREVDQAQGPADLELA